uniref:RING-type domain-containing protein n=1 Tax=Catharus ustulatus TaxID=91951 RepID=A0A8C3UV90_CATUS
RVVEADCWQWTVTSPCWITSLCLLLRVFNGYYWNCPICRDARDDLAYVMPCLHQFCLACIIRWGEMQRVCPLCRELIEAVRFSVQTDREWWF